MVGSKPKKKKRKANPKQLEHAKETINGLIKDSQERAQRHREFINGVNNFLGTLTGEEKWLLFRALQVEMKGCGEPLK